MRSRRAVTSGVSSSSCLSAVVRKGRLEAMKSARRPGSSMLMAMVCRSSESVGEEVTISWNWLTTLRCRASSSGDLLGLDLVDDLVLGGQEGLDLGELAQAHALLALGKDEEALVGHFDDFVDGRAGADVVQVGASGVSWRASRWATTRMVFSSPSDWMSWMELSRPTVRGRTACGKQHRIAHRENRDGAAAGFESDDFGGFCCGGLDDAYEIVWHVECPLSSYRLFDASSQGKVAATCLAFIGARQMGFRPICLSNSGPVRIGCRRWVCGAAIWDLRPEVCAAARLSYRDSGFARMTSVGGDGCGGRGVGVMGPAVGWGASGGGVAAKFLEHLAGEAQVAEGGVEEAGIVEAEVDEEDVLPGAAGDGAGLDLVRLRPASRKAAERGEEGAGAMLEREGERELVGGGWQGRAGPR